jgi:hypothetical protein
MEVSGIGNSQELFTHRGSLLEHNRSNRSGLFTECYIAQHVHLAMKNSASIFPPVRNGVTGELSAQ